MIALELRAAAARKPAGKDDGIGVATGGGNGAHGLQLRYGSRDRPAIAKR